jgi:outer membrane biosynthesis protein TonB
MRPAIRWSAGLLLAGLAVLAVSAAYQRQDDDKDKPAVNSTQDLDKALFGSLRDVINRGAEVYNDGDHAGCYRIFEGALRSVKPLLAHHKDLQKLIDEKLTAAEGDPVVWRRAFTLRSALDKVREKLNPNPKKDDKDKELKGKPKDQPETDKDKNPKSDKDKDQGKEKDKEKGKTDKDKDQKPNKDGEKDKDGKDKDKDKADKDKGEKKDKEDDKKDKDKDKKEKEQENRAKANLLPLPDVEKNG